jgi:hypothetical protein
VKPGAIVGILPGIAQRLFNPRDGNLILTMLDLSRLPIMPRLKLLTYYQFF